MERYLLRNLPWDRRSSDVHGLVKRTGLPMVRQGMAETRKRVWYLSGRCTPTFFFPSCALVASKVVHLAVTCTAGFFYDSKILTLLTRWGYPALGTSALVWGCTSPG